MMQTRSNARITVSFADSARPCCLNCFHVNRTPCRSFFRSVVQRLAFGCEPWTMLSQSQGVRGCVRSWISVDIQRTPSDCLFERSHAKDFRGFELGSSVFFTPFYFWTFTSQQWFRTCQFREHEASFFKHERVQISTNWRKLVQVSTGQWRATTKIRCGLEPSRVVCRDMAWCSTHVWQQRCEGHAGLTGNICHLKAIFHPTWWIFGDIRTHLAQEI